jgi:hemerythrin
MTTLSGGPTAPAISWNDALSVGIGEFDSHHKRIIALINKLQSSVQRDDDGSVTREVLAEVSNYTLYHFSAEEDLMEKYNYPGYAEHREKHLELTARTLQLMDDAYRQKKDVGQEVLEFLVHWLKDHIMVTDKQYTTFFREKGLS